MPRSAPTRRRFLQSAVAGGTLLGLDAFDGLGFLSRLRPVSAAEAKLDPGLVRPDEAIEPTVRLLEETPRDKLLEEVAARIRKGLSYREVLAGLLLAGVRNVQPRPHVGFKFHAVLVVNSAHLASLSSPDSDRWLPIFWALDYFKSAQAATLKESGWRMPPPDEAKLPRAADARDALAAALDKWDVDAADRAAAAFARAGTMNEAFDFFAGYGPRDFRDIGHKAIYVSNAFRTLSAIGWQHAEPVLRSLAYALLAYDGGKNPADADLPADRPWRRNVEWSAKIGNNWREGKVDDAAAKGLLATLRTGSEADAADAIVDRLNGGVAPQSCWDAVLCGAAELLMRKRGIVTLHAVTSANALRFAFDTTASPATRQRLLLQAASFVPLFRDAAGMGGKASGPRVDELEPADKGEKAAAGVEAVADVFATAGRDRPAGAAKALGYLQGGGAAKALIDAARRLVFVKGDDAHDYKYSSAVLEDHAHLSPGWRDKYLAASLFQLPVPTDRDNNLIKRARAAMEG